MSPDASVAPKRPFKRSPLGVALRAIRREVIYRIGFHPGLFRLYMRLFDRANAFLVVGPETGVVLEGFGGSGNSFGQTAFKMAQSRKITRAHHLHAPAQILLAIRHRRPTMVFIREPEGSVISLISRDYYPGVRQALRHYTGYYRALLPLRDHFVIAEFSDVTKDFGARMEALNRKFGTDFERFEHTPENMERWRAAARSQSSLEWRSSVKEYVRRELERPDMSRALEEARAIYKEFNRAPMARPDSTGTAKQ